jgi:hypothetical protein
VSTLCDEVGAYLPTFSAYVRTAARTSNCSFPSLSFFST